MRRLAVVCLLIGVAGAERVEDLIPYLGSGDPVIRRQAADRLLRIGRDAIPQLERALEHTDPEIRRQARWLLDQMPMPSKSVLPHLRGTAPELRRRIDDLIALMLDWEAGRESLEAKEELIAIGKPAFPRVLGAMLHMRDTITDVDSMEERLIESSLKLADEVLRGMDGYLTARGHPTIRPGSDKRHIARICLLHQRRWLRVLRTLPEMPGPFDPGHKCVK